MWCRACFKGKDYPVREQVEVKDVSGAGDSFFAALLVRYAEFVNEFGKNFTLNAGIKQLQQTPAGSITFKKGPVGNETIVNNITTTELSAELRWAPNEKFYKGKNYRTPIITKNPIFRLRYIAGIKGLFNGEYSFQNINLNISKRMYMAQAGYTDLIVEGGYVFGKVPFPLLTIHKAPLLL